MKHRRLPSGIIIRVMFVGCFVLLAGVIVPASVFSQKAAPVKPAPTNASAPQGLPLLVDVGADKCIPCIKMAPILEDLKREYAGILNVEFVDVWKRPEEAQKYRVRGIPTQIFYDASRKELGRHMGFIGREDILKEFERLGVPLKKPSGK